MKQQLRFQETWNKTIAERDRQQIKQTFDCEIAKLPGSGVHFTSLWHAVNYQDSLLLTVLIHNCNHEMAAFNNPVLQYRLDERILARHACHFSEAIPGQTSMPWTFIFPKGTYTRQGIEEKGKLEIAAKWI